MPDSQLALSRFPLFAPTAALPYWFVSYDFAGALGMEYSRDAARELERVLGGSVNQASQAPRVRVDYEADEVTLRIRRNEDVIPALQLIYERLGWDAAELDRLDAAVRACKRPRPRKIAVGDTFLVPVGDDLFGVGQVLEISHRAPTVAIFPGLGQIADVEARNPTAERPLSIMHLGLGCSLLTGEWPVVASHAVVHSPSAGFGGARNVVGSRSYGGDGYVVRLLRAHAGLDSWEEGFADPDYLRKLVMK